MLMLEIILVPAAISLVIYKTKALDAPGSFLTFIIASFLWWYAGLSWVLVLFSFLVIGHLSTKWKCKEKKELGINESKEGMRGVNNVFANAISPLAFVFLLSPIGFLGAVATALADTLSSEIGSLSKKSRLITNLKPVKQGTDGAISPRGTAAAITGSFIIAAFSPLLGIGPAAFYIFIGGVSGCFMDSFLGATFERKNKMNNNHVNLLSSFFGGVVALLLNILL